MPEPSNRIYLDVCASSRPFDDPSQMRIRLETEAVQLILSYVRTDELALFVSPVHQAEINAIRDSVEREHLLSMLQEIGCQADCNLTDVRQRAEEWMERGIGLADAAHLAFAEAARASFITCDDRLIRQCRRLQPDVWCGNPLTFCSERGL